MKIHKLKSRLTVLVLVLTAQFMIAQNNNTCADAFVIANPSEYCSGDTEFNTTNSGGSEFQATGCFEGVENDVWFRFTAIASAVNIVVNGDLGGSLSRPRVQLSQGSCGVDDIQGVLCEAKDGGADVVNLLFGNLSIGLTYFIRVGGQGSNQGSFQLCVNNFNPPTMPGQDAETASLLCDKSGFVIQALSGGGMNNDEAAGTCLDVGFGNTENQSSWTTWIAANDGELTFSINPINTNDDIDFVLYELPNGIDDFTGKTVLRCMASSCIGATGLNETSTDVIEQPGCDGASDNFLSALKQEAGKAYALLINNFSNTGIGVSLTFGGDGTFSGPDADFAIQVDDSELTCDKILTVEDNSSDQLGQLVDYQWNFGEDATPQVGEGEGPFEVSFASIGQKFVVLTITSDLGCKTTTIKEIEVLPCCSETSQLAIEVFAKENIGCGGNELGAFSIRGEGGLPTYMYNFNGGEYGNVVDFSNLALGDYEVGIIDRKGCEIVESVSIIDVNPISVDAGPDLSVEFLGDSIMLEGSYNAESEVTITWTPSETISCSDGSLNCLNPVVTPLGTTTYTLFVSDNDGCVSSDEVTVEVLKIRPVYAANAFSPNDDGVNDYFSLVGNSFSVETILEFSVYDRWGNRVYEGRNLSATDVNVGWDGRHNEVPMTEGIYIWIAKISFLDERIPAETLTGDVMLIR